MAGIEDHELRYSLANELHARPFPTLEAPCRAIHLAIKKPKDAAARDREEDRAHLIDLLDRFGAAHPQPDATHYFGEIGRHRIKWESHSEFVTYTIFAEGVSDVPFDAHTFGVFPDDWLQAAPGQRITSILVRVEREADDDQIKPKLNDWFVRESLSVARVLEDEAVVAGDFRIDESGHTRFAMFARPSTDAHRIGRVVQRICEIETYKAMSMLGFARCRNLSSEMGEIDGRLTSLMEEMTREEAGPDQTLTELLGVSSRLENMLAQSAFRFGATRAYEALVHQRIEILREERFLGMQMFSEFMLRRFDPAMRTVASTQRQLNAMADRAMRAGDLLRTRVDVERSAQSQLLLQSMDRRADLQLRLQHTVEGLSVVAISYYAVNLALYAGYPVYSGMGVSKGWAAAVMVPVVLGLVWWMVRRIRRSFH